MTRRSTTSDSERKDATTRSPISLLEFVSFPEFCLIPIQHVDCKRSRVDTYDPARKLERFDRYRDPYKDQYQERRRHDEGGAGRPRTPPERPPSRGLLGDGPKHLSFPVEPEDMELSDSGSPGPEVVPLPSCSALSVCPEVKPVSENPLEIRCSSVQGLALSQFQ